MITLQATYRFSRGIFFFKDKKERQKAAWRSSLRVALLALFILPLCAFAQERDLRLADKHFEETSYRAAIHYYQRALKKGARTEAMRKLAECYRLTKDYKQASKWYSYVVNSGKTKPEDHLRFGQVLMIEQRYNLAKEQFEIYIKEYPEDDRGPKFLEACKNFQQVLDSEAEYEVKNLPINSEKADFCAVHFKDGVVFSSSRGDGSVLGKKYHWDGNPFLDLYYSKIEGADEYGNVKLFKGKFNSKFHEAVASFDEGHSMIFFTRNNNLGGKKKVGEEGFVHLQIYYAHLEEKGGWTDLRSLPFNNDHYSVGHPALTPDGNILFFTSDMPGGYGGTDIYYSLRDGDAWGDPVNLGPLVNTVGEEMFPFIHEDGTLYFSSTGHGGLGGLEIFSAHKKDNEWGDIQHLPAPVNSSYDDFGYYLEKDGTSGFFSSDRPGGQGLDDIYSFKILNPTLSGLVVIEGTETPIPDAKVTVTNITDGKTVELASSPSGQYSLILDNDKDYKVHVEKPGFAPKTVEFDTRGANRNQHIEQIIELRPPDLVLDGLVRDKNTGEPIPGAEVVLIPDLHEARSGVEGDFHFPLDEGRTYTLEARKPGYKPVSLTFSTNEVPDNRTIQTILEMERDKDQLTLEGLVLDRKDTRLKDADIYLINLDDKTEVTGVSGPDGDFVFPVEPNTRYQIVANKFGYITGQTTFTTPESSPDGKVRQRVYLDLPKVGQAIVLKNIYYDFDEWYIREDAAKELQKLHDFLTENPTLRVELSSHTDSRGSDSYNRRLSQRRADAAVRYLEYLGIKRERLVAAGYGEEKHVNNCSNGVPCSEKDHQKNRRTEFTIIGYYKDGKALVSEPVDNPYYYGAGMGERPGDRAKVRRNQLATRANGNTEAGGNGGSGNQGGVQAHRNLSLPELPDADPAKTICFRVQIGVFSTSNKAGVMKKLGGYKSLLKVDPIQGVYRYTVGNCAEEEMARVMVTELRAKGFSDAFVVGFQNGERVKIGDRE